MAKLMVEELQNGKTSVLRFNEQHTHLLPAFKCKTKLPLEACMVEMGWVMAINNHKSHWLHLADIY